MLNRGLSSKTVSPQLRFFSKALIVILAQAIMYIRLTTPYAIRKIQNNTLLYFFLQLFQNRFEIALQGSCIIDDSLFFDSGQNRFDLLCCLL